MKKRMISLVTSLIFGMHTPSVAAGLATSPPLSDRSVWTAQALYAIHNGYHHEDIPLLRVIEAAYATHPDPDPESLVQSVELARGNYLQDEKVGVSPSEVFSGIFDAFNSVPDSPNPSVLAQDPVAWGNESFQAPDPVFHIMAQVIPGGKTSEYSLYEKTVLHAAWELAQRNPSAAQVINKVFGPDFGESTSDSTAKIFANHSNSFIPEALEAFQSLGDSRDPSPWINLASRIENESLDASAQSTAVFRAAKAEATLSVISDTVSEFDPSLGRGVAVIGNSAFQLAHLINSGLDFSTIAGAAAASGGIALAILPVFDLFMEPDNSSTQGLAQLGSEVQTLSTQVSELNQQMNLGFQQLSSETQTFYHGLSDRLAKLATAQEAQTEDLENIRYQIANQSFALDQMDSDFRREFQSEDKKSFRDSVLACLNSTSRPAGFNLALDEFVSCGRRFSDFANFVSLEPAETADPSKGYSASAGLPLGEKITLLSAVAHEPQFNYSGIPVQKYVNPSWWAIGAQSYLTLQTQNPDLMILGHSPGFSAAGNDNQDDIGTMILHGQRLQVALDRIARRPVKNGLVANTDFFNHLVENYVARSNDFINAEKNRKSSFEVSQASGFDLAGTPDQPSKSALYIPTVAGPCEGGVSIPVSLPDSLRNAIPQVVQNAAILGLGSLQFCANVYWTAPRESDSPYQGKRYARLGVEIRVSSPNIPGAQGNFFDQTIQSDREWVIQRGADATTCYYYPNPGRPSIRRCFTQGDPDQAADLTGTFMANWNGGENLRNRFPTPFASNTDRGTTGRAVLARFSGLNRNF